MDESRARTDARRAGAVAASLYAVVAILVVTEQFGQTTEDTRLDLTNSPIAWLRDTFSLWDPRVSLGELQNQAYGYLWPQGPFYAVLHLAGVPGWLSERLWSTLLLVLACEGLRRVARAMGLGPWASLAAGLAYALDPRLVSEIGVRSAEILPAVMLPWALLPVVLAITGRLRPRYAAVLSAAAFSCFGGVNATATFAPAVLLVVVVVWAAWRHHLSWRFAVGWAVAMVAAGLWWATSLVLLGRYSPPFFDYVEDAATTTGTSGFAASLRGASNWVDYLDVDGHAWWPAGYLTSYSSGIVLAGAATAVLGVLGLVAYRGLFRAPLLFATGLGLLCLTLAHTGPLTSPLAGTFQHLLDTTLAPLRNVPKADPVLRVPLCLGLAVLVEEVRRALAGTAARASGRRGRLRRVAAAGLVAALVAALVGMAWPVATARTRTPGWSAIPSYWTQASAYLDRGTDAGDTGAAWVVPGTGFGIETWGWTQEEPLEVLGHTPWVTRSQVPLTPSPTIRMLSTLEDYLTTGAGSPYLAAILQRIGVDRIVVRHDLDPEVSESTPSSLVSVALARSPGLTRVATFGRLAFGPAIEVYRVGSAADADDARVSIRDLADTTTVASSVEDAVHAVGAGLVGPAQPMVVRGETGWERAAQVQGDGLQRRERAYGRVGQNLSNVMTAQDHYRQGRVQPDYPGPPGSQRVVARYDGIADVTASSSQGYADVIGPVEPADAPWSALDGDPTTAWRPAAFTDPQGQWLDVDLGATRTLTTVTLQEPRAVTGLQPVLRWRLTAGGRHWDVAPDTYTGQATVDLGGVRASHLRVEVAKVASRTTPIELADLQIAGVTPSRTLVVPQVPLTSDPDLIFTAAPETRACATTLLGPDCDLLRQQPSDEATGIDRTFTLTASARFHLHGLVVARSDVGTEDLVEPSTPPRATGSSWFGEDPTVSPRMAYDGDPTTSWLADPRDHAPTLTIDLGTRRSVDRLTVDPPASVAAVPTHAVVRSGQHVRVVDLADGLTGGRFKPLTARRLTITFTRPGGRQGAQTLGVGEVHLSGSHLTTPLDGAGPTGSVCGLGPTLVVDGRRLPTRVSGSIGSVVADGQLAVHPCGSRRTLALAAGQHRVQLLSTHQFQPVTLELGSSGPPPDATSSRSATLVSDGRTHRVVRVSDGAEAVLSLPQSFNAGWTATLDGHRLQALQVDGWSQGWIVPQGRSGDVVLSFAPQRTYVVSLVVGLALLGLVLLAALVLLVSMALRRGPGRLREARLDPTDPAPVGRRRGSPSRRRLVLAAVAALALGYLLAGPVVGAAAVVGVLLARRPALARAVAALLLGGATVALVAQLQHAAGYPASAIDLVTGAGLAVALASAAAGGPPREA